jgi:hypothetical protein
MRISKNKEYVTLKYKIENCTYSWDWDHKIHINIQLSTTVYMGTHSPACESVGESRFRRLEKKLSTLPVPRRLFIPALQ